MNRHVIAVVAALLLGALGGCFGGDDDKRRPVSSLREALSHLSAEPAAVVVVPTDLDSGPLHDLDELGKKFRGWDALKAQLESRVAGRGLDFDAEVRPQLGAPFVAAVAKDGSRVGALRLRDPAELRRAVQESVDRGRAARLPDPDGGYAWRDRLVGENEPRFSAIVDGYLLVADRQKALEETIDAPAGDNVASDERVVSELEKLDGDALLRVVGDARRLLAAADPGAAAAAARRIPWVAALGELNAVARVGKEDVKIAFTVKTDRRRLSEDELPLPPGRAAPLLHDPDAAAVLGVLQPDGLARFIERVAKVVDPERFAPYESTIDQLRDAFGVDLHKDLLAKVTNLSVALASGTAATFQARLEPGAGPEVARTLARARPFVEEILRDLVPGVLVEGQGGKERKLYSVRRGPITLARYAIRDNTLVGSVGLAELPKPGPGRKLEGADGALSIKAEPARLGALVGGIGIVGGAGDLLGGADDLLGGALDLLSQLGEVTLSVRAETGYLAGKARQKVE